MADVRLTATNPADSSVVPVACNEKGELKLEEIPDQSFDGNLEGDLTVSGSAEFVGDIQVAGNPLDSAGVQTGAQVRADGGFLAAAPDGQAVFDGKTTGQTGATSKIYADGSAEFAGNKAGFTAEGYLWCTTRRGDTVILDATSNGLASWMPYTPPNRLTELQDRWADKDGILPVPHESSQDKPETPQ